MRQILLAVALTALVLYFVWVVVVDGTELDTQSAVEPEVTNTVLHSTVSPQSDTSVAVTTEEPTIEPTATTSEVFGPVYPMTIGTRSVFASIADTDSTRQQGLSGTPYLPPDEVKLFVFAEDKRHGFWMKDMNYAIDMMWVSATGTIVHIEHEVSPESYPTIFQPPQPARYVIETNAGFVLEYAIATGDTVTLPVEVE